MYIGMLGHTSGEALFQGIFNNPDLGDNPTLKNALDNLAGNAVYKVRMFYSTEGYVLSYPKVAPLLNYGGHSRKRR